MHPFMDHYGDHCKLCLCWKEQFAYLTTLKEHYEKDAKIFAEQLIGTIKNHIGKTYEETNT